MYLNKRSGIQVLAALISLLIFTGCANKKREKQEFPRVEEKSDLNTKTLQEVYTFMQLDNNGDTPSTSALNYRVLNSNNEIVNSDAATTLKLYRTLTKSKTVAQFPIFEATESTLFAVSGKGFVGNIWALLLVDRESMEIQKIHFGHQAETDGYGAAMSSSSFSEQFIGAQISFDGVNFGLVGAKDEKTPGQFLIDGISGATMTSGAVISMLNKGMAPYENYLKK